MAKKERIIDLTRKRLSEREGRRDRIVFHHGFPFVIQQFCRYGQSPHHFCISFMTRGNLFLSDVGAIIGDFIISSISIRKAVKKLKLMTKEQVDLIRKIAERK